jgi:hypothetical protein
MRISCIIVAAAMAAGCGFPHHHHDPPSILAERTNSVGVVEQLIEQRSYTTQEYWLTPEGSHKVFTYDYRFYSLEKDKPRRELPIKNSELQRCEKFGAVQDTPLWVGIGADSMNTANSVGHPLITGSKRETSYVENDFQILVFDDQHIVAYRQFLVISRRETPSARFRFENGNRAVVFLSPIGPKRYDILKDSVKDVGPATWDPPHL